MIINDSPNNHKNVPRMPPKQQNKQHHWSNILTLLHIKIGLSSYWLKRTSLIYSFHVVTKILHTQHSTKHNQKTETLSHTSYRFPWFSMIAVLLLIPLLHMILFIFIMLTYRLWEFLNFWVIPMMLLILLLHMIVFIWCFWYSWCSLVDFENFYIAEWYAW